MDQVVLYCLLYTQPILVLFIQQLDTSHTKAIAKTGLDTVRLEAKTGGG